MREKLLWAVILLLLVVSAALGYGFYKKSQQNVATPQNQTTNTPTQTPELNPTPPANTPVTPTTPITGRDSFGPQISPDGKWLLSSVQAETASIPSETENRLVLKGLFGQGDKILVSGKAGIHPAGWSTDGAKVYYLSKLGGAEEGCGGAYPDQTVAGDTLYEVTVGTGKSKSILQIQASVCGTFYGIHDVNATKNIVLFEQPADSTENLKYNMYVSDLTGGSKKMVTTVVGTDGVTAATLSPDGTKFAVVINVAETGPDFTYKLLVVDIASGSKKEVALPKNDRNYFNGWVDNNTVSITSGNSTKDIQVR